MKLCAICNVRPGNWCKQCTAAYDRATRVDDGSMLAIVEWAAKRARLFAKRRKAKR